MAVNPVTNKIYVANTGSNNVTVIDGTNNSTQTVADGAIVLYALAVNPVTNKIFVANYESNNLTVITQVNTSAIPLNTTVVPFANNTATVSSPVFSFTATSTYSPTGPPPTSIYFQIDSANGEWTRATNTGNTATTLSANGTAPVLKPGIHIVYFFASDGLEGTSSNPLLERFASLKTLAAPIRSVFDESVNKSFEQDSPESTPVISGINAYLFMVPALVPDCGKCLGSGQSPNGKRQRNRQGECFDQKCKRTDPLRKDKSIWLFPL